MKQLLQLSILVLLCVESLSAQSGEPVWVNVGDSAQTSLIKPAHIRMTEGQLLEAFDNIPCFGMYKDNYFITGIPTDKAVNKYTADAKYQISISQRLTKTVLPYNTFLMLTYTQKSFWDIYEKSSPFADNNYNPGLVIGKPIIYNNQLRGLGSFAFEHESNGLGDSLSRSWNYFVISGTNFFNRCISVQVKLWAGWLGEENADLFKYRGYGLVALNYRNQNSRILISAVLNPRPKFMNFNTQLEGCFKLNKNANQYLFLQWYEGYGESLSDYNRYTSMVRVGICIKHPFSSYY